MQSQKKLDAVYWSSGKHETIWTLNFFSKKRNEDGNY